MKRRFPKKAEQNDFEKDAAEAAVQLKKNWWSMSHWNWKTNHWVQSIKTYSYLRLSLSKPLITRLCFQFDFKLYFISIDFIIYLMKLDNENPVKFIIYNSPIRLQFLNTFIVKTTFNVISEIVLKMIEWLLM